MPKKSKIEYTEPPVVETVISVQYSPIENFTSAHVGWFWKNYLDEHWSNVTELEVIADQFEKFGDDRSWMLERGINFVEGATPNRFHIHRDDNERLIQIQQTRFIYNWKKGENDYPSFDILLPEFFEKLDKYKEFVQESSSSELEINQWEVIYVNHLLMGKEWESPNDWRDIFSDNIFPLLDSADHEIDNIRGSWSFVIGENLGRNHITLSRVRLGSEEGAEALRFQFTARGPISGEVDLEGGLRIGHDSIVESFSAMTSKKAHEIWGKS